MQNVDDGQRSLDAAHDEFSEEGEGMPSGGEARVYRERKSIDEELLEMVELLNIPLYALDRLSVRRVLGVNKTDYCFDFAPADLPITERVRRTCGPGDYQIWILKEKKTFHKRLKLHVSQDEALRAREMASRDRGQRSGGVQQDRGHQDRGQQNGHGRGNRRGSNQGIQQEMADLKRQISAMQTWVQAPTNTGTGITHTDLIDAEDRGYKRAKDNFDIQLSAIKEHHETQLTMIKESKGTERYLDDQEGDEDEDMSAMMRGIAAAFAPAIDALSPLAEGYRTQKETEYVIARKEAGLPPEPDMEEEPEPEANDTKEAKEPGKEGPVALDQKVLSAMTTLVMAASNNEDSHQHAEGLLDAFEPSIINGLFLAPGSLNSLFAQRPDLISLRPWFESLISHMALINSEKNSAEKDEQTTSSQKKPGEKDEKNVRKK